MEDGWDDRDPFFYLLCGFISVPLVGVGSSHTPASQPLLCVVYVHPPIRPSHVVFLAGQMDDEVRGRMTTGGLSVSLDIRPQTSYQVCIFYGLGFDVRCQIWNRFPMTVNHSIRSGQNTVSP